MISVNGVAFSGGPLPAPGTAGQVLTLDSGLAPEWASGGGGTYGRGTLAARPASPAAGDTYSVTSGARAGYRYQCLVAGIWSLIATSAVADDLSTGWTTVDGTGGASIAAGALTLTHAAGTAYRVSTVNYNGPSAHRDLPANSGDFDLCARVASLSGENRAIALIEIADTPSDFGNRYSMWIERTSGDAVLYCNTTGATLATIGGRIASWTGEEWIRISVRGARITAFTGVGVAGARPTSWLPVGSADAIVAWSHCSLSLMVIGTSGATTAVLDGFASTIALDPTA